MRTSLQSTHRLKNNKYEISINSFSKSLAQSIFRIDGTSPAYAQKINAPRHTQHSKRNAPDAKAPPKKSPFLLNADELRKLLGREETGHFRPACKAHPQISWRRIPGRSSVQKQYTNLMYNWRHYSAAEYKSGFHPAIFARDILVTRRSRDSAAVHRWLCRNH